MKKFLFFVILVLTYSIFSTTSVFALQVFPGAKGFGSTTPAGRGGKVYKVTNLNDSGPGSLRECIEASGPRVCIFEVSGNIELKSPLNLKNPYITIAGQTAPSPGITIIKNTFYIQTHDVLVQHLRFRLGDESGAKDTITVYNSYNVVLDHCSVSWGVDGDLDVVFGSHDVTINNSIISETLDNSVHPEGPHSRAMIVARALDVSIIQSLYAHNNMRHPESGKEESTFFLSNNLIYNYGKYGTMINNVGTTGYPIAASVSNAYLKGPNTKDDVNNGNPITIWNDNGAKLYLSGNSLDGRLASEQWNLAQVKYANPDPKLDSPPLWPSGYTPMDVSLVEDYVLANSGSRPADRDSVDKRIINDVISGTGGIIDSQNDVGGWPSLPQNRRELTLPANINGDDDGDGYTNLEEWLHEFASKVEGSGDNTSLADTVPPTIPTNLAAQAVSAQINLTWDASSDTGGSGLAGYTIYRNGDQIATTRNTSYSDKGLSPSTTYSYTVSAYDAAGNHSEQSNQKSATTQQSSSNYFEAENMRLTIAMTTEKDDNASGGQYIIPISGSNSSSPSAEATSDFIIPSTGTYYLWIRMYGPDSNSDSLYVGIDNSWDRVYPGSTGIYEWVRVETSNKSGNYAFELTSGDHVLQIGHGEINSRADVLFLTNDPNEIPSDDKISNPKLAPPQGLTVIRF